MKLKVLLLLVLACLHLHAEAQTFSLGAAQNFAALGSSTVTSTGPTRIVGSVGVSPGLAIVGFPPGVVTQGTVHSADALAVQGQKDLKTAYGALTGMTPTVQLTGQDLGGLTLRPGIYHFNTSAQLTGTLTLDAHNDPDALFVFQMGSTLTTGPNAAVLLVNGGNAGNIFWQVGSSATLGVATAFKGNILAYASVTVNTGASILTGRALAEFGGVTMDANAISVAGTPRTTVPAGTFASIDSTIVFQSRRTGAVTYETFDETTPVDNGTFFPNVSLDRKLVGAIDLNGDGFPDLLFQSQSKGSVTYALMNGLTPAGQYGTLFPTVPAGFVIVGTPDINGDGQADILFQNQATGDVAYVLMHGLMPGASDYLFRNLDRNLKLVATLDLNGDSHVDFLFQNTKTGDVVYALMNGTTPIGYGTLFQGVSLEYKVVGAIDLNGDGVADIVFQGQTNGDVSYALMKGLNATSFGYLARGVDLDFKIGTMY